MRLGKSISTADQKVMRASRSLIERAMGMRCDAYMTHVKHRLLMQTIYEVDESRRHLMVTNRQLAEIDRIKTLFIASMTHEINNPLTSIIGFSEMILKGSVGPLNEKQLSYLQTVVESAEHLKDIVADAMDIAKIEANTIESIVETFDLSQVITDSIQMIQQHADEKGIAIKLAVEKEIQITSDLRRLKQCLINLISNAVKYTDKGHVCIEAKKCDAGIEITVTDTGIGISNNDLKHLFEAFNRGGVSLRTTEAGSGIGLFVTNKLVHNVLKGRMEVDSELDKGSVFKLLLPNSIS
jgi:signal transduction histidine kinase